MIVFNKTMKSYIVKKTQKRLSIKRDKSLQSQDELRASSVAERSSQYSQRKSLLGSKLRGYSKSMPKTNVVPYDYFVRELKIKLPSPKQKFYQFLKIAPFNRIQNQNELIALFLKNVKFFKLHQPSIIMNMARKVKLVELYQIDQKMMVIVLQGSCRYKNDIYTAGHLINRAEIALSDISDFDPSGSKLIAMNRHEYLSFLYTFINQEMVKIKEFINSIQTFKMFTQKTIQKFTQNMTLHYYLKGEKLYKIGEQARTLFIVYSGMVSRKVIIQLQKVNKIPPYARKEKGTIQYQKFEREVRILTKQYEHKIEFGVEDLVGLTQIIDNVSYRKEEIDVNEDTILLGIDRTIIQEHMDDYIMDRLKKYNLKKYPSSYDQLCDNYLKEKLSTRKTEERKIIAMQNELKLHHNDRRREKIEFIIKMYQNNIKNNQKANLKKQQLDFYVDKNK